MIWLTWRQFRPQAVTGLALLAAAAALFLVTGSRMHDSYATALAGCAPMGACDGSTAAARALGAQLSQLQRSYELMFMLLQLLVIAVPAVIGIFWGAPLIGRELETGTHQLAWNQTVTRTRWLAVKLGVVGVAAIAATALLTWLLSWWAGPLDHLGGDRWAAMTFASRGTVPLGYAAFAFALGTTLGLLLRRTLPAMAITLAVFTAVQILMPALIRPHLLPSTTTTYPIDQATTSRFHDFQSTQTDFRFGLPVPKDAWLTSQPPVENSAGQVARVADHLDCLPTGATPQNCLTSATAFPGTTCTRRSATTPRATTGPCSGWRPDSSSPSPAHSSAPASGGSDADRTDPPRNARPRTSQVTRNIVRGARLCVSTSARP
ncbi:ABC transporter permease subunit [Catellatospora sp. KI3]|uniref:ABC transporter permease subunit n=1 Tax=Catellatospora sp. KI3 TaxID=3041620 RepID=UPI002482D5F5|nr:ABC transporter permease subunit [Catellatospora sp. KI3]MDI1463324.1 ABC transporter permease subunit [Catellatospora sp. KI3]